MMPLLLAESRFAAVDWLVVSVYLGVVIAIGVLAGRRSAGKDEFFLAGRSMPVWAVAISVLATSLSAATFIGGPQEAYAGNLTYLSTNIGGLIAIVIVAVFFLPVFYRRGVTSIYEVIGHTCGSRSRSAASAMFMVGRVFASGARLFMVAIPFSLITFGTLEPVNLMMSIVVIAAAAAAYTSVGGIRAVIWTDVLQAVVLTASVAIALWILLDRIPASTSQIVDTLANTNVGDGSKLTVFDTTLSLTQPYTLAASLTGWVLFLVAAFGCDQDLVQRMLTCKSARAGAWSAILSNIIGWPVVALFLIIGLLLFVFFRSDLMGDAAPGYRIDDSRKVFLEFILNEVSPGMRGVMLAGLFAAAMSSLDSALNAMSSTTIADFYRPWRARRSGDQGESALDEVRASRIAVAGWAVILAGFACLCVLWYDSGAEDQTLIRFALGVMMFAYSGLLAVFATALFTSRGNSASVLGALITGFLSILLMQHGVWSRWAPVVGLDAKPIALPWQMLIATALSFLVCIAGRRRSSDAPAPAATTRSDG